MKFFLNARVSQQQLKKVFHVHLDFNIKKNNIRRYY